MSPLHPAANVAPPDSSSLLLDPRWHADSDPDSDPEPSPHPKSDSNEHLNASRYPTHPSRCVCYSASPSAPAPACRACLLPDLEPGSGPLGFNFPDEDEGYKNVGADDVTDARRDKLQEGRLGWAQLMAIRVRADEVRRKEAGERKEREEAAARARAKVVQPLRVKKVTATESVLGVAGEDAQQSRRQEFEPGAAKGEVRRSGAARDGHSGERKAEWVAGPGSDKVGTVRFF